MNLAKLINKAFSISVVVTFLVAGVMYVSANYVNSVDKHSKAKDKLSSIFNSQLPYITQELVNETFYAFKLRSESLEDEYKDRNLITVVYDKDNKIIYMSQIAKQYMQYFESTNLGYGQFVYGDNQYVHLKEDIKFADEKIGGIFLAMSVEGVKASGLGKSILLAIFFTFLSYILVLISLKKIVSKYVVKPIHQLVDSLPSYYQSNLPKEAITCKVKELDTLAKEVHNFSHKLSVAVRQKEDAIFEVKKKEALSKLASQVTHDIRSPISALNMVIDSAERSMRINDSQLSLLKKTTRRINEICETMLNETRSDKIRNSVVSENSSQIDFIREVKSIVQDKQYEYQFFKGLTIEFINGLQKDTVFYAINNSDLSRMLSNVINNSVSAIKKKNNGRIDGKVIVSVFEDNEYLVLSIKDNGIGLSNANNLKLFDRGVSTKKSGNGLGLYFTEQVCKAYNGKAFFNDEILDGAELYICLSKKFTVNSSDHYPDKLEL